MANTDDADGLTTEDAAEHLRRLRDTLGPDQLREAFETGGGLMDHEENRLRQALEVVGTRRSAEILGVEVPDAGLPGEQVTIGGEPVSGRVAEERAEPVPEHTASLSEFEGEEQEMPDDEQDDENEDGPNCADQLSAIERLLSSARRQGFLDFNEFDQAITAAERDGCVTSADATRLRDTAQSVASEPTDQEFDQLFEDLQLAIDVDEDGEEAGGATRAPQLTEDEALDVVQRVLDIEGPDAIAAFLDPEEIAPLGQAISFQLSGAVETLGRAKVRSIAQIADGG